MSPSLDILGQSLRTLAPKLLKCVIHGHENDFVKQTLL